MGKIKSAILLKLLMVKAKRSKLKMNDNNSIYMLNALWFKPDGVHNKYKEYMKSVSPLLKKYGGRVHSDLYVPQAAIIGEFDADMIFFIEWPDWPTFMNFANDPDYESIRQLREDAITNSLLIRCAKI